MNGFLRISLLLVPTGIVRLRLVRKGYEVAPVSSVKVFNWLWWLLPSLFWAIVFMREETDKRVFKYFLPYGLMRLFISKVYRDNSGEIVFRDVAGSIRVLRLFLPYGLVQWWDFGYERLETLYVGTANDAKRKDIWGRVLSQDDPIEAILLEGPVKGGELEWMRHCGEKLFASDRLDLFGRYLEIVGSIVASREVNRAEVGVLLKKFGWPFFRSLIGSYGRIKGFLESLQECVNLATEVEQPRFGSEFTPENTKWKVSTPINDDAVVSVIMPVFNCARYLIRAIESVRRQTYSAWELICVNDGSSDESAAILDWYAEIDKRIRVVHKENSGVSDTRNQGLKAAKGDYILFLDGDDWYELNAFEEVIRISRTHDLDLCFFDYRCRKYDTLKEVYHFWTFSHIYKCWDTKDKIFAASDLNKWFFYGAVWQGAWKRSFLLEHDAQFPRISLGEDFALMCELFPFVKRAYIINKPFYNYQRGNPTSAVSRLDTEKGAAFISKYQQLQVIDRTIYSQDEIAPMRYRFAGRVLADLAYDCKVAPALVEWLKEVGYSAHDIEKIDPRNVLDANHLIVLREMLNSSSADADEVSAVPETIKKTLLSIEAARDKVDEKIVYLVSAQLASLEDEAIDGWTFFKYLKKWSYEAKFVVRKEHRRYQEFKAEFPKDVIAIDSDKDFSYLTACEDIFPRVKAIAMEWPITNSFLSRWISKLSNCCYVFLQHGVTFNPPRAVHHHYWQEFNLINFCSEREKTMVMPAIGGYDRGITPVVAGLPRWDVLKDEQDASERIVFVMFTWRPTFNQIPKRFANSAYANGLRRLLSPQNAARLKANGLKVVLAQHHALRDVDLRSLELSKDVVMGGDRPVSYWIRHAACLLTDFSSVAFDFWRLSKPVVYWLPDLHDDLLSDADQDKVRQADAFLKGFVNQVATPKAAIDSILRYAEKDFALEEDVMRKTGAYCRQTDNACQKIVEAIDEYFNRQ